MVLVVVVEVVIVVVVVDVVVVVLGGVVLVVVDDVVDVVVVAGVVDVVVAGCVVVVVLDDGGTLEVVEGAVDVVVAGAEVVGGAVTAVGRVVVVTGGGASWVVVVVVRGASSTSMVVVVVDDVVVDSSRAISSDLATTASRAWESAPWIARAWALGSAERSAEPRGLNPSHRAAIVTTTTNPRRARRAQRFTCEGVNSRNRCKWLVLPQPDTEPTKNAHRKWWRARLRHCDGSIAMPMVRWSDARQDRSGAASKILPAIPSPTPLRGQTAGSG